ncbi:MAG: hypothetical protein ACOC0P_04185 [Planctomycetota bacterium]
MEVTTRVSNSALSPTGAACVFACRDDVAASVGRDFEIPGPHGAQHGGHRPPVAMGAAEIASFPEWSSAVKLRRKRFGTLIRRDTPSSFVGAL